MAIEKLSEFAKDGQKNTDDLVLTDGFSVSRKPARQWFNWLFNTLTSKVNEIIDADFIPKADIVDNLTTDDAKKPVSAKQAKNLQDSKLDKTANAVSSSKLETARTIAISGAVTGTATGFDGSANISIDTTGIDGSKVSTGTIPAARIPAASTSAAGAVKLNNTLTSTSTTEALTAAQGKVLNDRLVGGGRNWNNVKANRLLNTTYRNPGPDKLEVALSLKHTTDSDSTTVYVGDYQVYSKIDVGIGLGWIVPIYFTVNPGESYKVTSVFQGNFDLIEIWSER